MKQGGKVYVDFVYLISLSYKNPEIKLNLKIKITNNKFTIINKITPRRKDWLTLLEDERILLVQYIILFVYASSPKEKKAYQSHVHCTIVMLIQIYFQKEDCVSVVEEGRVQLEQCGDTPAPISYHSTGHLIELR